MNSHLKIVQPSSAPMTILVALGQQYGQTIIIPLCERAKLFAAISGTTTLTRRTVEQIKALGYTVSVRNDTPETL